MGKLSATSVKAAVEPGRYGDGDGLFLFVDKRGGKSWVLRAQKDGKRRDIGLGGAAKVSLKMARDRAAQVRAQIESGLDPVTERRKLAGTPSFREAAAIVHAEHKRGWKNGKHSDQWIKTLAVYAYPKLGELSVASVDSSSVRDTLAEIWLTKPETARRLKQRIRTVIDWAVGKGYREATLPWPVIDKALPKQRDKPKHHAALPYADIPKFIHDLRSKETMGRFALEAAILTASRSGEVRGALWPEVNLERKLWIIPAERMKAGLEHIIPLSEQAVELLTRMKEHRRGNTDLVFPGTSKGKPLSDMTLTKVIRDMGYAVTAHGFRSTFRTWVAEQTSYPREVAEAALAHVNPNDVEAAYQRGNMLDKRRDMMIAWAQYCEGVKGANIVALAAQKVAK